MEQLSTYGTAQGASASPWIADPRPTALIIAAASDGAALAALAEAAGARLLGQVTADEAHARLDAIAEVDLILVHATAPCSVFHTLLPRLDHIAADGDAAVIVSADMACIDLAFAALGGNAAQLLCDPAPLDLAGAVALALQARETGPQFWDIGRESEAARLQRLSEEVGRLARTLDSLTRNGRLHGATPEPGADAPRVLDRASEYIGEAAPSAAMSGPKTDGPRATQMRDLLRVRRQRDQYLPGDLFADPAWDMMLDLMAARLAGERVSVSSLCIAAAVPPTTALRWIRQLTERGFFLRQADPADGRRIFIALSDEAAAAVSRWFAASRRILCDSIS
jgi:hypothetical protein